MTIVGCRIDGRLIHGQVANLWSAKLNLSRIMVVDNEVVNNDVEKLSLIHIFHSNQHSIHVTWAIDSWD